MPIDGPGSPNLILAGFMGTGKTAVGRLVAQALSMPFLDTDAKVEATAGRTIADILTSDGEARFRKLEATVCQQAARRAGHVIATGGGALLNVTSRGALERTGLVICLDASLDAIVCRIGNDPLRPLAGTRRRLARLLSERRSLYASLPHHIDTTGRNLEQVVEDVVALWHQIG